ADLLIVKIASEGAPAHGSQPAEAPFQGCYDQGLDLVTQEAALLGEPIVALINVGAEAGPIDGTSAMSAKIDSTFGANNAGKVYVSGSGDDGALSNHALAQYTQAATAFPFTNSSAGAVYMQIWYTGGVPANVTVSMSDGASLMVSPGTCLAN